MKSAFISLIVSIAAVMMCGFLVWGYLRGSALAAPPHQPLDHPFLRARGALPETVIFRAFGTALATDSEPYTNTYVGQLAAAPEDAILWLDVHPLTDNTLVVGLADQSPSPLHLEDVLKQLAPHRMVLNFTKNRPGTVEAASRIIENTKSRDLLLLQSPEDGFLKDAREAQPLWIFGTGQAQITRFIMLAAVGLEPMAALKSDTFVFEASAIQPLIRLHDSMINEVHRRGMKVFAGPATAAQEIELRRQGVDGILTQSVPVADQARTH